jgi:riboflavin kinase / FMN adenylyltransferase
MSAPRVRSDGAPSSPPTDAARQGLGELRGEVIVGDGRGRTIGFPTANLAPGPGDFCPPRGVYAALADGRPAAVDVGYRPTFDATPGLVVEVHILDYEGDLYGRVMTIRFLARLRDERKFDSPAALVAQLAQDIAEVRALTSS